MLGASFPIAPFNKGATPMPKTKKLMMEEGTMATNFFIHTPICCPSRSEVLSGKYFHNIKKTGGATCMHVDETHVNNATFARFLADGAGYKVGMFGKYLNNVPNYVPLGFDAWMANGGGDYIAPAFATFNCPGLPDGHWHGNVSDYSTSVIGNKSIEWIQLKVKAEEPWFAYIAPKVRQGVGTVS
jgi:N-acetylglucosamine-6-sulfatase